MTGPFITDAGDIISTASDVAPDFENETHTYEFTKLLLGQVVAVYAIDDGRNQVGKSAINVVYDVLSTMPDGSTEYLKRCRMMQPTFGGGPNNFFEVLHPDPGQKAKDPKTSGALKRGSYVLVGFIAGQKNSGVILGAMPHPSRVAIGRRPKKKAGSKLEWEFQGLNVKITNDGSYTITFNGPRNDQGKPVTSFGPTTLSIDNKGRVGIATNADQTVEIDRVGKTILVANGATTFFMEQEGAKITVQCDEAVVNTDKSATVDSKGTVDIKAAKDVKITSATAIKLARGESDPTQPFVLGTEFKNFMEELIGAIASITHIGNLGNPVPPPLNASQIRAMSGKLESLLSKLILGEK